jgi:hypothetical protein
MCNNIVDIFLHILRGHATCGPEQVCANNCTHTLSYLFPFAYILCGYVRLVHSRQIRQHRLLIVPQQAWLETALKYTCTRSPARSKIFHRPDNTWSCECCSTPSTQVFVLLKSIAVGRRLMQQGLQVFHWQKVHPRKGRYARQQSS